MTIHPTRYYTRVSNHEYMIIANTKRPWEVYTQYTTMDATGSKVNFWRRLRPLTPKWTEVIDQADVCAHDKSRQELMLWWDRTK